MTGYWRNEDATKATLDADGWLHTGDVGYVDVDGYLVITDRLKDLIITSTGKNVAPAHIEGLLMADPLIEQAVLLGDNRPCLTLLCSPHLAETAAVVAEVRRRVTELTQKLAHHEQIRDLRILLEEFTQDNGLLTPTLKVKRREVEQRFAQLIDDMYAKLAEFRGRSADAQDRPD